MAYDSSTDDKLMTKGVFKKFVDTYYNKAQIGLGNVDNTSDADKPVSTAQASAISTAKTEAINQAVNSANNNTASKLSFSNPGTQIPSVEGWVGIAYDKGLIVSSVNMTTTSPVQISQNNLQAAVQQLAQYAHTHGSATRSAALCHCDCNGYCSNDNKRH